MKKLKFFLRFVPAVAALFVLAASCASVPRSPDEVTFRDALGNAHTFLLDTGAALCPYDRAAFSSTGNFADYSGGGYTVRQGLDISRHNGEVDWASARAAGYDFVILRVAYRGYQTGVLHLDERFHENMKGAQAAGFDVGVYVFSQAITEDEALEEAEFVLDALADYEITLPVVFDPESISWDEARTDGVPGEQFTRNTVAFCERVRAAGYAPMVYANMLWEAFMFDMAALRTYPFWYADYEEIPQSPYDFSFWQITCFGEVPGVTGDCDVNIWLIPDGAGQGNSAETAGAPPTGGTAQERTEPAERAAPGADAATPADTENAVENAADAVPGTAEGEPL